MKNLSLTQKAILLVGVPLLLQLACYSVLFVTLKQADKEREREAHQKEIVLQFNSLYRAAIFSGQFMKQENESSSRAQMDAEYGKLEKLVQDNPVMLAHVKKLRSVVSEFVEGCRTVRIVSPSQSLKIFTSIKGLKRLVKQLNEQIDTAMLDATRIQTIKVESHQRQRKQVTMLLGIGIGVDIALAISAIVFVISGWARRLERLMTQTKKVAAGSQLEEPMTGSDEIAQLDKLFYDMATKIRAEENAKHEIIRTIAYDLLNPINRIKETLENARFSQDLAPAGKKRLETVDRSLNRLVVLINDLLSIEQLAGGNLNLQISEVKLLPVLERSADAVKGIADARGIKLVLPSGDDDVAADADRIVQVAVNILSNALKFSPDGSTITISTKLDSGFIKTSITDQGKGIGPENLSKIFEPFEQVKEDAGRGTGLGLAICKEIIEQHKGKIGVESELGTGSTFWFTLPAKPPE